MARRSKKSKLKARPSGRTSVRDLGDPPPEGADEPTTPGAAEPASPQRFSPRSLLIAALAVAALWWVVLGALAIFTANPVTLNREQILRSDYIVTGTVADPGGGTVDVSKEWKRNGLTGTIETGRLDAAGAREGRTYIIPLESEPDGTLEVTRSRLPNDAPLIYPATPEAEAQLSRLLSDLELTDKTP